MTYDVLLENGGQRYQATVLGLPSCSTEGATREEALRRLRTLLRKRLSKAEIVQLELEDPEPDPMLKFAGVFKDDPLFDEVEEEIRAYRREIDADEGIV